MTHDPITQKLLVDWFVDLETPLGFRAELVEGEFVLTPPPDGNHEHHISRIVGQVYRRSRTDMQFSGHKGLILKRAKGRPLDHVIPDGTFAPSALRPYRGAAPWMPCEGVALTLEVTSPTPHTNRVTKRRCYARGGVPLYLLVDREASSITLFSTPEKDDYREHRTSPFGKPLTLPAPFSFDLDTTDFL
ncbi:Uma2 family endonuclease [Streptomyces sp. AC512_CC834]|uniref:Uma2 family endonuclease n=1 Tax=Streptomyces sp. AC512_CC834 TaxID=2823691 RepID=UPI001C26D1A6|nr:Uma2 family endonuclease [Streptomyces sp. AC512_CC834]